MAALQRLLDSHIVTTVDLRPINCAVMAVVIDEQPEQVTQRFGLFSNFSSHFEGLRCSCSNYTSNSFKFKSTAYITVVD